MPCMAIGDACPNDRKVESMTQPDPFPPMSAAAKFVRRGLQCLPYHDLDNDWLQLDCCARQFVRVELKRIVPFLLMRYARGHDSVDWQRLIFACRFIGRDEI
jgi:hypothetical protein